MRGKWGAWKRRSIPTKGETLVGELLKPEYDEEYANAGSIGRDAEFLSSLQIATRGVTAEARRLESSPRAMLSVLTTSVAAS